MNGYECFIFAWDGVPSGGMNDVVLCCDTKEEALTSAEKLEAKYEEVQIMDKYGDVVT